MTGARPRHAAALPPARAGARRWSAGWPAASRGLPVGGPATDCRRRRRSPRSRQPAPATAAGRRCRSPAGALPTAAADGRAGPAADPGARARPPPSTRSASTRRPATSPCRRASTGSAGTASGPGWTADRRLDRHRRARGQRRAGQGRVLPARSTRRRATRSTRDRAGRREHALPGRRPRGVPQDRRSRWTRYFARDGAVAAHADHLRRAVRREDPPLPRQRGGHRATGSAVRSGSAVGLGPMAYLDHAATTPMLPEALEAYVAAAREVGNASSLHAAGPPRPPAGRGVARAHRRRARRPPVRGDLHRRRHRERQPRGQGHLLGPPGRRPAPQPGRRVSAVEHHAVLDAVDWLGDARGRRGHLAAGRRARAGSRPRRCAELRRHGDEIARGHRHVGQQRGRHGPAGRRAGRARRRGAACRSTPTRSRRSARCRSTSPPAASPR